MMRSHRAHTRFVWNLAVEQHQQWHRGRKSAPGFVEQCRQLTAARAENDWLRAGSQMVQQQALRDFSKAMKAFFDPGNPARRPSWRKAGRNEGFRIVSVRPGHVRRLSRNTGEFWVPKLGWVRFRWSRAVPEGVKSYRVTRGRAGRWHVAFAAIPDPVPLLHAPGLIGRERARLRRLEQKAPGRMEKINPAFTSQRCPACGHVDANSRETQARGGCRDAGPVNREPHLLASFTGCE
jgi:putative transposase